MIYALITIYFDTVEGNWSQCRRGGSGSGGKAQLTKYYVNLWSIVLATRQHSIIFNNFFVF